MSECRLCLRTLPGVASLHGLARRWSARGLSVCWLDSAQGDPERARQSVLAVAGRTALALGRSMRRAPAEPPLVPRLRGRYERERARRRIDAESWASAPFLGGLVGYVAYEAQIDFDPAFPERDGLLPYPRLWLRVADTGATVEHGAGRTHLWAWREDGQPDPDWSTWEAALASAPEAEPGPTAAPVPEPGWGLEAEALDGRAYLAGVRDILGRIAAGEVYQVNLTGPVPVRAAGDPLSVYARLRRATPSDYSAFLAWPGLTVMATSPEEFFEVRGRLVRSRPMKGTRRRLGPAADDEAAARELLASPKDRAENLMIVDLVRNDLGRVAEVGSVSVPRLFAVERYATVLQMTSTVQARLGRGQDAFSALGALFPPGSMTGAPKVQATRVIRALEPWPRGLYSGCLGAVDWLGNAVFNVVIRTLVGHPQGWSMAVGGGIVADSDPDGELDEARAKLAGVARALGG